MSLRNRIKCKTRTRAEYEGYHNFLMKSKHQAEVNEIKAQYCTQQLRFKPITNQQQKDHLEKIQMVESSHEELIRGLMGET